MLPSLCFSSFEHLTARFSCKSSTLYISVVYRPPSSSFSDFFAEFDDFLALGVGICDHLIIGDFNIHTDCSHDISVNTFLSLLSQYSLVHHVAESTHAGGHTLDLVVSHSSRKLVLHASVYDLNLSDHLFVHCTLNLLAVPHKKVLSQRRNLLILLCSRRNCI